MRILLNASNLRKGGAVNTAVSIVCEIIQDNWNHKWFFAISDKVACELEHLRADTGGQRTIFDESPARSLSVRRKIEALEETVCPDVVFTLFGPAYVRFRAAHLLGCAQGWVTHPNWQAYRSLSFPKEWLAVKLSTMYQTAWYRKADAWVVQTESARIGLARRLTIPLNRIGVVPNNCASVYYDAVASRRRSFQQRQPLRILSFSAMYRHKRLDIIPDVALDLTRRCRTSNFQFVLTLPDKCSLLRAIQRRARRLGVDHLIVNEGPVLTANGPALYDSCDISFLPTVLETFSATYPETMAMGLPMVTTDLPFARDVCKDAALYFRPNDARDAAKQLACLIDTPTLARQLTETGQRVVAQLPSPAALLQQYLEILERLVATNRGTLTNRKYR